MKDTEPTLRDKGHWSYDEELAKKQAHANALARRARRKVLDVFGNSLRAIRDAPSREAARSALLEAARPKRAQAKKPRLTLEQVREAMAELDLD